MRSSQSRPERQGCGMPRRRSSPGAHAPDVEEHPHLAARSSQDTLRLPMVLRPVSPARRRPAESMVGAGWGPDGICWELVDAAGDDARPPAALALTHSLEGL